jgi:hypothetical protein
MPLKEESSPHHSVAGWLGRGTLKQEIAQLWRDTI